MNRRKALEAIGYGSALSLFIPDWAKAWNPNSLPTLSHPYRSYFDTIAETLLPETDKPGAKTLKIADFLETMVADTFDAEKQYKLKIGIAELEVDAQNIYRKEFNKLSNEELVALFTKYEQDAKKPWAYSNLKGLAVWGYTTSEYYLTQVKNFEFAPGYFSGCVKIKA
jgi:hypothetical protein